MANNPYVNKVEYGNRTIMDLTNDDVTPSDVLQGVSFHDRSGAPQTGSLVMDEFTSSVSPVNSVVTFNNLNPDYGYKLYVDIPDETTQLPTNLTNITVRKWTNKKRSTNSDGTINLAYTVTDTSIQYCLRILK